MMTKLIIDTSVLVAAVSPNEHRHAEALELMQQVHGRKLLLEEPAQFLLELYAVLNRRPRELRQLGFMTEDDPVALNLRTIGEREVQGLLEWLNTECPGKCPTRGADLAYVAVALETGALMVTLDNGLHRFAECGVDVGYPSDVLERMEART